MGRLLYLLSKDSLFSYWSLHMWAVSQMVPNLFASAHVNAACHGAAVLLCACSLVRCASHPFVFPCLKVLFQGTPPLFMISCKALSGHSVDVDSLHISHAEIFMSMVRVTGCSPPQCQFTIEDVFRNATIIHMADVTQPSQSALSKQSVHTGKISTRQEISVGYFVLPGSSQDTADASDVECVEPSLLPGIVVHVSLPYSNVLITQAM